MRKILAIAIIGIFALSFSGNVFAETNATDDEWHFTVAPLFLWGLNIDGTTELGPVTTPLNLDFKDDVLSNLAAVFTIHFEARKKDWTIFAEYQYAELDPSIATPRRATVDIDFTDQLAEIGVAYKVGTSMAPQKKDNPVTSEDYGVIYDMVAMQGIEPRTTRI